MTTKRLKRSHISLIGLALIISLPFNALATGQGKHEHKQSGHHEEGGHHQHDKWETPPTNYMKFKSDRWQSSVAIRRGKAIYAKNCASCHGADGKGRGPLAANLPHPPADLTSHFHRQPGDGDAYLFWRISEGGSVEPFKSMQSSMPAFKAMLSENERWDTLAYVHKQFHIRFLSQKTDSMRDHKDHTH